MKYRRHRRGSTEITDPLKRPNCSRNTSTDTREVPFLSRKRSNIEVKTHLVRKCYRQPTPHLLTYVSVSFLYSIVRTFTRHLSCRGVVRVLAITDKTVVTGQDYGPGPISPVSRGRHLSLPSFRLTPRLTTSNPGVVRLRLHLKSHVQQMVPPEHPGLNIFPPPPSS